MVRWWSLLAFLDKQTSPLDTDGYILRWVYYEAWKHQLDSTEFVKKNFPGLVPLMGQKDILGECRRVPEKIWDQLAYPQWLYDVFQINFGSDTVSVLKSLNEPAPVCLRANTLKTDREKLKKLLSAEGVEAQETSIVPDGLILTERKNVFVTKAFKEGFFEVQDLASQKVSALLKPLPGERIADVCAGAGGKTLHLAALMKNKGTLLACDVSTKKLEQLKIRARRAGVSNLRIQEIEGTKTAKRNAEKFDGVLVDAPCSGTGVLRRNSDTKWKLNPEEILRLKGLQAEIATTFLS